MQVVQQPLRMNWSHFKPEFSSRSDEDVEAHLLRTNDWMTTHDSPEAVKVQRFCLTLVGEVEKLVCHIRDDSNDLARVTDYV